MKFLSPPTFLSLSSTRLFSQSRSINRLLLDEEPSQGHFQEPNNWHQAQSMSENQKKTVKNFEVLFVLCRDWGAPSRFSAMVTTFVGLAGNCTRGMWKFLEKASRVNIRLTELEHPSLCKIMSYCLDRILIYVPPCFYKSLKLWFPLEVRGLSRDGRVTTELSTGSLRHAVGILITENFRSIVDNE